MGRGGSSFIGSHHSSMPADPAGPIPATAAAPTWKLLISTERTKRRKGPWLGSTVASLTGARSVNKCKRLFKYCTCSNSSKHPPTWQLPVVAASCVGRKLPPHRQKVGGRQRAEAEDRRCEAVWGLQLPEASRARQRAEGGETQRPTPPAGRKQRRLARTAVHRRKKRQQQLGS